MKTTIKGTKRIYTNSAEEVVASLDVDLFTDKRTVLDTTGKYLLDYDVQEDDITLYKHFKDSSSNSVELVKLHPSELPEHVEWSVNYTGDIDIFDPQLTNKVFTISTVNYEVPSRSKVILTKNILEGFYDSIYETVLENIEGVTYITVADTETGEVEVLATDRQDIIDTFTQANIKKQLDFE